MRRSAALSIVFTLFAIWTSPSFGYETGGRPPTLVFLMMPPNQWRWNIPDWPEGFAGQCVLWHDGGGHHHAPMLPAANGQSYNNFSEIFLAIGQVHDGLPVDVVNADVSWTGSFDNMNEYMGNDIWYAHLKRGCFLMAYSEPNLNGRKSIAGSIAPTQPDEWFTFHEEVRSIRCTCNSGEVTGGGAALWATGWHP